jgi:hypothetical protein
MPLCIDTPSVAGRALLLFVAIAMFFSSAFCRRSQCLACQRNRDAPASSALAQSVSLRSWNHPHLSRKADRREVSAVRRAPPPRRSRARPWGTMRAVACSRWKQLKAQEMMLRRSDDAVMHGNIVRHSTEISSPLACAAA